MPPRIGIMLGPVLGPTVGGFVTEHLNWRWVFHINLPIGLLNPALHHWLAAFGIDQPDPLAVARLVGELARQSSMLALTQTIQAIALSFLLMAPLLILLRRDKKAPEKQTPGMAGVGD